MPNGWRIPHEWADRTAFLIGGGPSLSGFDAERIRGRGAVIAINEAGLTVAPWADVHYFPDPNWLEWNIDRVDLYSGPIRLMRQDPELRSSDCKPDLKARIEAALPSLNIKHIERETVREFSFDPRKVAGVDGGGNAINMAFLFGAKKIVLLGFDMKPTGNFHDKHKRAAPTGNYDRFRAGIGKMVKHLNNRAVEVINATPDSALDCFPRQSLEEMGI